MSSSCEKALAHKMIKVVSLKWSVIISGDNTSKPNLDPDCGMSNKTLLPFLLLFKLRQRCSAQQRNDEALLLGFDRITFRKYTSRLCGLLGPFFLIWWMALSLLFAIIHKLCGECLGDGFRHNGQPMCTKLSWSPRYLYPVYADLQMHHDGYIHLKWWWHFRSL